VRVLHGQHAGSTMIVSAARGRPANRDATELSLSRDGGAVAFASAASNLGGDPRGVTQVWERGLALGSRLRLLSVTPGGRAGDAPSSQPSVDHDGRVVAFVTRATNLLPGANGLAQVVRARTAYARPRLNWISQTGPGTPVGIAASSDPTITDGGAWVFFDAPGASNLTLPGNWTIDRPEVYRWSSPALLASKDTTLLALRSVAEDWAPARTGAWNPDTSARGNYLVFESEDQSLDATLPGAGEPPWYSTNLGDWILPHSWQIVPLPAAPRGALTSLLPGAYGAGPGAGGAATGEPRLHQVYLHYLGPDPHPFDAPGAGGP
jgi:hypothetical protein